MDDLPDPVDCRLITPLLNNLYWVHRDIVEAIARSIPARSDEDIVWLSSQLRREAAEVSQYRGRLERIGFVPTQAIRIQDSLVRYRRLKETECPIELAVGMNVVAQGTLGIIEHECLYRRFPDFLPFFPEIIDGMGKDLETAIAFLREQPREAVEREMVRLWQHLHLITIPELDPLLAPLIARGIFPATIVADSIERFLAIADQIGFRADAFPRH